MVALCVGVAGCALVADDGKAPDDAITVTPDDRSRGVPADAPVEVSVPEGHLESVRMVRRGTGPNGTVAGEFAPDRRSWRPLPAGEEGADVLELASQYTVDAVAVDATGRRVARHTTFTTKVPPHRFTGFFRPEHRQTVGTAMIVSLVFNRPITDRAAVERAVSVTAEPHVPVAAHWFGRSRLDFRPQTYWKPGTRVTLDLRLRDVRGARGVYGTQRKKVWFTIGRDQRSVVDVRRHRLTVQRAGAVTSRVPVTAGTRENPTYNGRMVISEKYRVTRMDGGTVGFGGEYDIDDVPHAMRLTTSGTFLHGNYWAKPGIFGAKNTSHGCIGLEDERGGGARSPAGLFFRHSLVGDLVTVQGTKERTVAPDNGLGGWNMPWNEWTAGSALS
ncbi:Ig-like domain-containing protein [Streptomyces iconiensis]|uniref:Ig-like domain-containing protein n=1 Tax=Streptomyces iconiensis TaxID=1384038 RepID=A0ABT7A2N8_9ACTN|nr:Ig-like domain-containing protein [Streptomyces iconiensis]MDJ1134878.1 Ig-like domain-containing protein [Streptomyces iconiensis]